MKPVLNKAEGKSPHCRPEIASLTLAMTYFYHLQLNHYPVFKAASVCRRFFSFLRQAADRFHALRLFHGTSSPNSLRKHHRMTRR